MLIKDNNILLIGDIHGRLHLFKKIYEKYPNHLFLLLGDLQDRGKKSKQLLDFIMGKDNILSIKGNHEELFLAFMKNEVNHMWHTFLNHGGVNTILSYFPYKKHKEIRVILNKLLDYLTLHSESIEILNFVSFLNSKIYKKNKKEIDLLLKEVDLIKKNINEKYVRYIESLPLYFKGEDWIATHAPIWETNQYDLKEISNRRDFFWNRMRPFEKDFHQFFGHNGNIKEYNTSNGYKIMCLDGICENKLCGYDLEKKELISVN